MLSAFERTGNKHQPPKQNNNKTKKGLAALLRRLLAHERWGDEYPHVPRFLACFGVMLLELCWENVMVWCVFAGCCVCVLVGGGGTAWMRVDACRAHEHSTYTPTKTPSKKT